MYRKPPIIRTGKSGWLGHGAARLKSLAVVGAVTLGFAGAAFAATAPASADPAVQFVGVGSDTTQSLMDFLAGQISGGVMASYDAVNPTTQVIGENILPAIESATQAGVQQNCDFTRPNGSSNGFAFLDYANNPTTTLSLTATGGPASPTPPGAGCVTFSRSSGAPGSATKQTTGPGIKDPTGLFVYIPFAVDAVTDATGPTAAQTTAFAYTSTAATPAVFTATGNNFTVGEEITLTTPPTGFTAGTGYFVLSTTSAGYGTAVGSSFELASSVGGSAIAGSTAGSGNAQFAATTSCVATTTGCNATSLTITFNPSPSVITTANMMTVGNLQQLYHSCGGTAPNDFVTVGGINYYPNGDAPTGVSTDVNIDLYAPQSGSGTLSFWESQMGNAGTTESCWKNTVAVGPATGITVEEHDGSALASDPNGIFPYSIAKWISFNSGLVSPDLRHGDNLNAVTVGTTVVPPISGGTLNVNGCGATLNQATCFPFNREVYNVLPYNEVTSGQPGFNPVLAGLFVGTNSFLCTSNFTISELGFGNLPNPVGTTFADLCGSTASTLRVQMMDTGN